MKKLKIYLLPILALMLVVPMGFLFAGCDVEHECDPCDCEYTCQATNCNHECDVNPYAALLVGNWMVTINEGTMVDVGEMLFTTETIDGFVIAPTIGASWRLEGNLLIVSDDYYGDEFVVYSRITFLHDDAFVFELLAMSINGVYGTPPPPPLSPVILLALRLP
jgi:hypothetical protein